MAVWTKFAAVALLLAGLSPALGASPDVDLKLATRYCEAAQGQRQPREAGSFSACMREFGYDTFRFGAGTRF